MYPSLPELRHFKHCNTPREVKHRSLYSKGKWKAIECKVCALTMSCKQWNCVCGTCWYACEWHARIGFCCSSRFRRKPKPRSCYLTTTPGYASNSLILRDGAYPGSLGRPPSHKRKAQPRQQSRSDSNFAALASLERIRSDPLPLEAFLIHPHPD